MLFFLPGSIWGSWYITKILEGNLNNLWVISTKRKNSWLVNELLQLREMAYLWIRLKVDNGERCYLWSSNWSPYGNIRQLLLAEGSVNIGIPLETTLTELWDNGGWVLPPARSETQVKIQTYLSTIEIMGLNGGLMEPRATDTAQVKYIIS